MRKFTIASALLLLACSDGSNHSPATTGAGGSGAGGNGAASTTSSSAGGSDQLPATFTVEGTVVDDNMAPVADAMVLQGGKPETTVKTDADGKFTVTVIYEGYGLPAVVAAKTEYRAHGIELFEVPSEPVQLVLGIVAGSDNIEYIYNDPGDGVDLTKEDCTHCHTRFVQQFLTSKHAVATSDPLLQDLYAGVNRTYSDEPTCTNAGGQWKAGLEPGTASTSVNKCYLGGGVLPDLNSSCGGSGESACDDPSIAAANAPTAFGACADCHAPGIDGIAGGRNLHDAVGLAYEKGVHCDVCHKVKDVDLAKPPGIGQRLILHRPNEPGTNMFAWEPVYYGPIPDVPNVVMGGSYQPKFKQAVYCAGCHQQEQPALINGESLDAQRWPNGLPVHSTYEEWQAGPYNSDDTPCQHCHMPSQYDMINSIDITTLQNQSITFGFPRPAEDTRKHIFRSPLEGSPRLIDGALYVSVQLSEQSGELSASVSIANVGCGHAVPTGEPMRSLVMVVEAFGDGSCASPSPSGGMTINDIGGALATGVEGSDITTTGSSMSWTDGAAIAAPGQVVRVVRPTGSFDDYDAPVGLFQSLPAAEKGMEIMDPVGSATVVSSSAGSITLDQALSLQSGDRVYLGEALPTTLNDGEASLHLAGAPGYSFARVLVDSSGERHVPHYRAIDMASDNRISPGKNALTTHRFSVAGACTTATVRASVFYRPVPTAMATLRGWEAKDYLIATGEQIINLP